MQTDWLWGLAGGLLIGAAGALYLLGAGRIMGASGILGEAAERISDRILGAPPRRAGGGSADGGWFIAGLVLVPAAVAPLLGRADTHAAAPYALLVVAGLCVGFGTRMANGCTSGHGVCGISRLSFRGIVATLVYIFAGAVTVLAMAMLGRAAAGTL
ncbi:MAG: YeeE/YedE family protein [Defluviimonas sp.]|uniref:YeeE/YedE family protein n=1 Tax=Albidovulum sp. TaxID=1872424 RepID=UPI001D9533D6|nr:YeeE/YedE family protein [Paracoccaceae bacterium]MCC0064310.1 YeeE/YedE family protein [Defluviimonas sp.]